MTTRGTACARRTSAITAAVIALVTGLAAAAVAQGCDRTVNLTPFYDAPPPLDGPGDGGFDPDAILLDGQFTEDGRTVPGDGLLPFPDDGPFPFPDDGPFPFPDGGPSSGDAPLR